MLGSPGRRAGSCKPPTIRMTIRPRTLLVLLVAAAALAVAACGGGSKSASSSTDVDQLLKDTFSGGDRAIKSGKISLSLHIQTQGGTNAQPIDVSISGPFESQGSAKLPKLALKAKLAASGASYEAGITSTGDKGFVNFSGSDYVVSDAVFAQLKQGYEKAQSEAAKKKGTSFGTLGIDPRRWLKNPRNAGETKVGGDDAIRITGDVDVPKLLDDVNTAIERTRSLGIQGTGSLPQKLTPQQRQQATDAIKKLAVEIDTGKDDRILRRMVVDLDVTAPKGTTTGAQSATIKLDLQFTDVNQSQDISAPANPKPLDQLLGQLGSLGLGGSTGSGSGSSGSSGSGSGGASSANLEKYSKCIQDAGNDSAKASKCADLLTAP
jgi:hypothetical protein